MCYITQYQVVKPCHTKMEEFEYKTKFEKGTLYLGTK